jgi:hypothetical protein
MAMAHPLRLEFPGALYHVTSRGDGQEAIYLEDADRRIFLKLLAQVFKSAGKQNERLDPIGTPRA